MTIQVHKSRRAQRPNGSIFVIFDTVYHVLWRTHRQNQLTDIFLAVLHLLAGKLGFSRSDMTSQ